MREKLKVKENNWMDIKKLEMYYGFDFFRDGVWYHAAKGGEPLLFETEEERDAAMNAFRTGMPVDYVLPVKLSDELARWAVVRGDNEILRTRSRADCVAWLYDKGLIYESDESRIADGFEIVSLA